MPNLQQNTFLNLVSHVLHMLLVIPTGIYFLLKCHSCTNSFYPKEHRGGLVCLLVCYYYKCILFFYNWANLQELSAFLHLTQMVLHLTYCDNNKNQSFL